MLLWRPKFPLGAHRGQRLGPILRSLGGFDDVIYQPTASRYVRIGKSRSVTLNELPAAMLLIFRRVDLMAEDNFRSSFGPHDSDFSRWPCYHTVGPQVLATH